MISVIEIHEGVVYQNLLFTGTKAKANAEVAFIKLVKANRITKFSKEEMDEILDDGYFMIQNWAVCISHPEVKS